MTDLAKKKPYVRRSSGDHPAVKCYREKLVSIEDGQLPELEKLNAKIAKLQSEDEAELASTRPTPVADSDEDPCIEVDEADILVDSAAGKV